MTACAAFTPDLLALWGRHGPRGDAWWFSRGPRASSCPSLWTRSCLPGVLLLDQLTAALPPLEQEGRAVGPADPLSPCVRLGCLTREPTGPAVDGKVHSFHADSPGAGRALETVGPQCPGASCSSCRRRVRLGWEAGLGGGCGGLTPRRCPLRGGCVSGTAGPVLREPLEELGQMGQGDCRAAPGGGAGACVP